jgi:glucosamine-6-phosphate deaminase
MSPTPIPSRLISAGSGPVRLSLRLTDDAESAARHIATQVAHTIRTCTAQKRRCVLGLPTGKTPLPIYKLLVEFHRAGQLSFKHVTTFNLDEYHGLPRSSPQSYWTFMHQALFDHVDIEPGAINLPRGDLPDAEVAEHAAAYERVIAEAGGLDLVLLGIGGNGHIAFNEPGAPASSRTRLVRLAPHTRRAAAPDFGGEKHVPTGGVTMGIGTILSAKRVLLLATGAAKAVAVVAAVEKPVDTTCPASYLQTHNDAEIICDPGAASHLTAVRKPWLVGPVAWDANKSIAAAIDVAETAKKPLLSLAAEDYQARALGELLDRKGPADQLNLDTFRALQSRITGWPGGKPADRRRPGDIPQPDDGIFPKTVVVFSPHPDDDVIGMGGTIARLVEHGHQVHIVYQTAGHRAVHDDDLRRHMAFVNGAADITGTAHPAVDAQHTARLKALVRRTEATAGAAIVGVPKEHLHFLDSPLYGRGSVGEDDVTLHVALLNKLRPHQVYSAGDLADPNGTHRRSLLALRSALRTCATADWWATCSCWLYRGAWDEYELDQIDRLVPMSPSDVLRKRQAVLKHQSQRDGAMFMGEDAREFWQRAEEKNTSLAARLDRLGLAQYAALEAFVRWQPLEDAWLA